jgi:hypothetical protein
MTDVNRRRFCLIIAFSLANKVVALFAGRLFNV